jgi:hypothetical protein
MRERADALTAADVGAIRAAARIGTLPAVKVGQERLGWQLGELVLLVHMLAADAEPNAAADRGRI